VLVKVKTFFQTDGESGRQDGLETDIRLSKRTEKNRPEQDRAVQQLQRCKIT
jgi:hypothetical protein